MKTWTRTAPLGRVPQSHQTEIWEYSESGESIASFDVDVTTGKSLDVLALKGASLDDIREYAGLLSRNADTLYRQDHPRREITECPGCGFDAADAAGALSVFGVKYCTCRQCGHTFVRSQPLIQTLEDSFTASEDRSVTYTDMDTVEVRLAQVVSPKLDWVTQTYRKHRGRAIASVLDVGAGGGHFVAACRRQALTAEGYEISRPSRRFASEVFGIELRGDDFLETGGSLERFDVLTFWGLLEYTPDPRRFLEAAHRALDADEGMLIVEVPRFDCLGTAVQSHFPDTVARHMDPTSHVNCFSDESLATALLLSGFKPVAAWYYGMDVYELLVQLALHVDNNGFMERAAHLIPGLQAVLDSAKLCDDIVVAAVPIT